jgi:hypothetical protein
MSKKELEQNTGQELEQNNNIADILKDLQKQIKELKNENSILKKSVAQDDIDLEIDNKYEDGELIKVKFNASALYDTRCEKLKNHHDKLAKSYFNKGQLQNIEILQNTFNAQYIKSAFQGDVVEIPLWFVKTNSRFVHKYINDPTKIDKRTGEPMSFVTSDSQVYIGIDENNQPVEKKSLHLGIEKISLFEIIS